MPIKLMPVEQFETPDDIPSVHDWTLIIGFRKFGITEKDKDFGELFTQSPDVFVPTKIFLGKTTVSTNLSAYEVVSIAAIAVICLIAAVALVITKVGRNKAGQT
jgi:hypothetical protein